MGPNHLLQLCSRVLREVWWGRIMHKPLLCFEEVVKKVLNGINSSKSALHGLIHWLAQAYSKKGITVNGIAPALVQDTKMLAWQQ